MSEPREPVPDAPRVHPATPDVASGTTPSPDARMPGAARSFTQLPTGPIAGVESAEPAVAPEWVMPQAISAHRGIGAWALGFAVVGLAASLFVGWGFPLSVVAIVTAAIALRRPLESRAVAGWALALGIAGLVYSAGWLLWAASRMNLFG